MITRIAKISISVAVLSILVGCAFQEERSLRSDLLQEARYPRFEKGAIASDNFAAEEWGDSLPEKPGISDYLEYAAINSPALRSAYYRWAAAVEKVPQARTLPDPKLSYTNYIREVETRVGPQKNRFGIMQMIPWPTKLTSKADMAAREAWSQKYMYEAEKYALFFKVRKAYYEYSYLAKSLQVVKDNLSLLENIEEVVRTRYESSSAANPSLLQLQMELGKQEDRLKSLEALRPAVSSRLSLAIGLSPKTLLPWPKGDPGEMPALDENELLVTLQTDNPGLKAARAKIRAAEAGERLARAQYLPDFSVGASFIETDRRTDMDVDNNGKDPVMVTVEFTLPLWWNKYAAGVREARAKREVAESALQDKSNQLSADLRVAYFGYGDAGRKLNLFADTLVPKAEQALEVSRTAFASGKTEFSNLLDTERTLLELLLMKERAMVDQAIRLAELEMLSGSDLRQVSNEKQPAAE